MDYPILIAEIETVAMSTDEPLTSEVHRELHHYTNWRGLEGIWNSGELFCTRFDCLNDSSEIYHLRGLLTEQIGDKVKAFLIGWGKRGLKYKTWLRKAGGSVSTARPEANNADDELSKVTLTN